MPETRKNEAQLIQPDAYPQMMNRQDAAHALKVLRSAQTAVRAQVVMESFIPAARAGVMAQVAVLEAGAGPAEIAHAAHEIRALAEPAGLVATGRIADVLCRYLDEIAALGGMAEAPVVQLHVSAVLRATHAEDEGRANCEAMVGELSQLVSRKLAEAAR
jgi:hypothetical protein